MAYPIVGPGGERAPVASRYHEAVRIGDVKRLATTRHDQMTENNKNDGSGRHVFAYTVDGKVYKAQESTITGAQIKAEVADYNPAFKLFLEGKGGEADRVINDADVIDLERGSHHFYSAPPATFGAP